MERGALIVRAFPFRFLGIWLFGATCFVVALVRFDRPIDVNAIYALAIAAAVFGLAFYCEYNRSVKWDAQGVRQKWRGAGYFFWEVTDEYVQIKDIQNITTDRWNGKWATSKAFMNIYINTADVHMDINPAYFKREEFEQLLRNIHVNRPDVVFDEDAYAFMNGEFLISFPYKFGTMYRLEAEGKMQIYKDGTCSNR